MDYSPISDEETSHSQADISRDKGFYRDTGDTVILVEDVLFNVHRLYLTECEDSTFRDAFRLPCKGSHSVTEGSDDGHPIVLKDTAEEFRALCWVLYALPADLRGPFEAEAIPRLVCLASITNKYNFRALEDWSIEMLDASCFGKGFKYMTSCSQEMLGSMYELAIRLDRAAFCQKVEDYWLKRLTAKPASKAHAFDVGEKLSRRRFLARAYYVAILDIYKTAKTSQNSQLLTTFHQLLQTAFPSPHDTRILLGHYSLSLLWDRICAQHISQCPTSKTVYPSTSECELSKLPSADVLGKLKVILDPKSQWRTFCFVNTEALQEIHDKFSETLPCHFFGSTVD